MDSITQAVLGAGISGAMLGRFHGRKALLAGALLATLPDLDVFIDYGDPVSAMINHRGFSHSVFVLTGLAAVLSWAVRRWRPSQDYGAARLFLAIWLVLITHPLLDAFTSYGTQLLWPFTPTPTSWSSIFIIDPFFTLPLLAAVLAGFIGGLKNWRPRALNWTLGFCATYLALSLLGKSVIETRVHDALTGQGVRIEAMFSTPEPFNILLWRVVARTDNDQYVEVISSLLDRAAPEHIQLALNTSLAKTIPNSAYLDGLRWFTDNWLRYDEINGQLVVTDLRMGLGTGFYSFRFHMGERTGPNGAWQAVVPSRWPGDRGQSELWSTLRRVWQQTPPLPLLKWEQHMTSAVVSPGPRQ